MTLPEEFVRWSTKRLPEDHQEFVASMGQERKKAILHNNTKNLEVEGLPPIPWHQGGRWLPGGHSMVQDPFWHAGCYYSMDASCMFLAKAIERIKPERTDWKILDLCAAPGGKSLLLQQTFGGDHLLVSNEISKKRFAILKENWIKWGASNGLLCNAPPQRMGRLPHYFDLVVVDAPCSGEGMFRKSPKASAKWNIELVDFNAQRQRKILSEVLPSLKPGGYLIYCTCTYNDKENIDNVHWLHEQQGLESIPIALDPEWNVEEVKKESSLGYQCWPHRVEGEGFFFSLLHRAESKESPTIHKTPKVIPLRKKIHQRIKRFFELPEDMMLSLSAKNVVVASRETHQAEFAYIERQIGGRYHGCELGMINKDLFLPLHALAMSHTATSKRPQLELDLDQALKYLRRESFDVEDVRPGWYTVGYEGIPLGWMKALIRRNNNHYPINWRIQKG